MAYDVVIAGYSHIFAMGVSKVKPGEVTEIGTFDGVSFAGLSPANGGERDEGYWKQLAAYCSGKVVALSWHGNQHYLSYLFVRKPLFDFYLDGSPEPVEDAFLIPMSVMREGMNRSLSGMPGVIAMLMEAGASEVLVIGTPPPKGDQSEILARIRSNSNFSERARKMNASLEDESSLTPIAILQKTWRVLQDALRAGAETAGATFLPVPPETQEQDGTLLRKYWGGDITHANAAYGKIVNTHIAAFVAGRGGEK